MAYNPYIVVPFATWAVAQVAKFALAALRGRIDLRYLYASGGMPSVHSAVVCSLATTAFLLEGLDSHLFGLTVVLAAIVMYDSFGVRRAAGEQGAAINMMLEGLDKAKVRFEQPQLRLREVLGHQPSEVIVGAVLGVVLGAVFNYERITPLTTWLQMVPVGWEFWLYVAVFAGLVVGGVLQRLVLRAKYPKSRVMRVLSKQVLTATQVVGWLGLVAALFEYERASYLAWRLWVLVVLAVGLSWGVGLVMRGWRTVPGGLAAEANEARKLRWFSFGRRKRKSKRA